MTTSLILHENATGFAIFESLSAEDFVIQGTKGQDSVLDLGRFGKIVKFKSWLPFHSASLALENINSISEGILHPFLKSFLESSLSSYKAAGSFVLGIQDPKLGGAIQEELPWVKCESNERIIEISRGIRLHFTSFIKEINKSDRDQASLGLAHAYSRSKLKYNVNKVDNMIIQAISILDQLDKDMNTFSMRIREWYSWHFPELIKIVPDSYLYSQCVFIIQDRKSLKNPETLEKLSKVLNDEDKPNEIAAAAANSMGMTLTDVDYANIIEFAERTKSLGDYRTTLQKYLNDKMHTIAPNLSELIGEVVGARLISHAGSLTSLAKYPASTVQILGAEKALFRALKSKGNTPKYGLIFNSSFIGRAAAKNKGRISRYLANKASIASRIDAFSDDPDNKFGLELARQVEERLEFYSSGAKTRKNIEVMQGVTGSGSADMEVDTETPKKDKSKKKKSKRKHEDSDNGSKKKSKKDETPEERAARKAAKKAAKKAKKLKA